MEESSVYRYIVKKGLAEGLEQGWATGHALGYSEGCAEEARKLLLRLGRKHLGSPDTAVQAEVENLSDLDRLEALLDRVTEVKTWAELLGQPVP